MKDYKMNVFENGAIVKVTGIDVPGRIVGKRFNDYIVYWDEPPYDHLSHQQLTWNAQVFYHETMILYENQSSHSQKLIP
jgi:PAS domain-containing protein